MYNNQMWSLLTIVGWLEKKKKELGKVILDIFGFKVSVYPSIKMNLIMIISLLLYKVLDWINLSLKAL